MAHDCGIKLRGTSPERLIADAQEMTRWIERLTGWSVTLDIAGTGWQASHEEHGQVFADDLPDLALKTFWQVSTAKDLPDMPDQVISAAFLAGWRYIRTEADRYIYEQPDGIRGSFTLGELEYELGLPESPAAPAAGSQDAPPVAESPVPDALFGQREVLAAWLTEHLVILREPVQRMLAQALCPVSTRPWDDHPKALRGTLAQSLVAGLTEEMIHEAMRLGACR